MDIPLLLALAVAVVFFARAQLRATVQPRRGTNWLTQAARYHSMNPTQFEHAIAALCERDGCHGVRVVGGAGDLGADVIAITPDGRRIVIQCKRYAPRTKVGSPDLQRFGGTCYSVHRAQIPVVVTTSTYTQPAVSYGVRQGIRLVDSSALTKWATRTGPPPWT
ncbi:restriction endonuclease [Streptomyces murinus]|uniref:restriction endonuclease n=1 Tax=Streptomyces murinus TaxID=33900 RepID=UPI0038306348